jgi:hypothetical protein
MAFRERGIPDAAFGVAPLNPLLGVVPGVGIPQELAPMADEQKTASADGYYTRHDDATNEDHQFFIAKGDPLPADATGFTAGDAPGSRAAADADAAQTDAQAQASSADAEADTAAKANTARKTTGPSETR